MNVDLLIENARVLTQSRQSPVAQRIAVLHGRVVALDAECEGLDAARRVNLDGAVVAPGFNDAHAHSVWFGHTLLEVDLAACQGMDDVYARIGRGAEGKDPTEWVVAAGYNQMDTGGTYPDAEALDRASGGRPVWIKHTSGHSCIVNQVAMNILGVTAESAEVTGGAIVRHSDGAPTGLLEETAMSLVQNHMLPAPQEQIIQALAAATRAYVREGLTSVTDAGIGGGWIGHSPQEFGAYQEAAARGLLFTRMQPMLVSDVLDEVRLGVSGEHFRGLPGGMRTGLGDDRLQLGPMKLFLDGSILSNTARISEGYCNHPDNHGYFQGDVDTMRRRALDVGRAGWSLAMHAVGDEAIDLAIEILTQLRRENIEPPMPHRLEHGAVVTQAQLEELGRLGAPIVAQPHFLPGYGDGFRGYIGDDRAQHSFPLASLLQHGLPVAGSSDRPVAPGAPLAVMQSAVERKTSGGWIYGENERLTAEQALHAYTVGSAQVTGWADQKGQIAPGFLADLVVLDESPVNVLSDKISQIDVHATVIGGEVVYDGAGVFGEGR
ncbi:MAG: amidohydrolase [Leucobacter sp.]